MTVPTSFRRILAMPEVGTFLPLMAFTSFFYTLNPVVLSASNVGALLRGMSNVGVIAIGMTLLMIC